MPIRSNADQSQRAQNPRPGQGSRAPYAPRTSNILVAPEPCANAGFFNWPRALATQCVVGEKYYVSESCVERDYFTKTAARAMISIFADSNAPKPLLLKKFMEVVEPMSADEDTLQEVLVLRSIQYGQLIKKPRPDVSTRAAPADQLSYVPEEKFESFDVVVLEHAASQMKEKTLHYVQAPVTEGGWYAEIVTERSRAFKVVLEFQVKVENFNEDADGDGPYDPPLEYGARLEMGQRGKLNVYEPTCKERDTVLKLTVGNLNSETGRLVAWKNGFSVNNTQGTEIVIKNDALMHALFDQKIWPTSQTDEEPEPEPERSPVTARGRYIFRDVEDRLCYVNKSGKSDEIEECFQIANFCIPELLAVYMFSEYGELPLFKLLCRQRLAPMRADSTDRVCYVGAEQLERAPSLVGCTLLEVEAVISIGPLKTPSDVKSAFLNVHSSLQTADFSGEMLSGYLNSIPQPLPRSVIVRWGLQDSGWFVAHNCAFKDGVMMEVEAAGHAISTAFFHRNAVYPMAASDFPRIRICPFAHVRYCVGVDMWNNQIPTFFQNNEMPTKVRPLR